MDYTRGLRSTMLLSRLSFLLTLSTFSLSLGQNVCPEGWIAYNDTCYQFNMNANQKMTWLDAKAACKAIGDFSTLVTINSQDEQDFINQRIQKLYGIDSWIGLNDDKNEGVFRWSADESLTEYQIWANGKPSENRDNLDCVMILSVRKDGAWSVQNCSQKQNYICMRHRGKQLQKCKSSQ